MHAIDAQGLTIDNYNNTIIVYTIRCTSEVLFFLSFFLSFFRSKNDCVLDPNHNSNEIHVAMGTKMHGMQVTGSSRNTLFEI